MHWCWRRFPSSSSLKPKRGGRERENGKNLLLGIPTLSSLSLPQAHPKDQGKECWAVQAPGRKLYLSDQIKNPTESFRVGTKPLADLLNGEWSQRCSDHLQKDLLSKNHALISANSNKDPTQEEISRRQVLEAYAKDFSWNPILDCVVWHDGSDYRVVIATNPLDGDLGALEPMTDYRKEFQIGQLSLLSMLNYSVNFYDDGSILSIVVNVGSHGSHVAATAAAYHGPDHPLNGVAPGAQLISLKIGDSRTASRSNETNQSVV